MEERSQVEGTSAACRFFCLLAFSDGGVRRRSLSPRLGRPPRAPRPPRHGWARARRGVDEGRGGCAAEERPCKNECRTHRPLLCSYLAPPPSRPLRAMPSPWRSPPRCAGRAAGRWRPMAPRARAGRRSACRQARRPSLAAWWRPHHHRWWWWWWPWGRGRRHWRSRCGGRAFPSFRAAQGAMAWPGGGGRGVKKSVGQG